MSIWHTQVQYLDESVSLFAATDSGARIRAWEGLQRLKSEQEDAYMELNQVLPLDEAKRLNISPNPSNYQ